VSELVLSERPAAGEPSGLLVLHHGRGADERDLLPLAAVLDPRHRFHVVTPRAPLTLPDWPGHHWYAVARVGYPDPATFEAAREALAALHDALWERTGVPPERTVLGGFSMGTAMSYALALSAERPSPAGVLAFSGFIPTVPGWTPWLADRRALRVFIAHGTADQVIPVEFARRARTVLTDAGLAVDYHESEAGHHIDPRGLPDAAQWLDDVVSPQR
jgi:phospholipase/carboxylesterase